MENGNHFPLDFSNASFSFGDGCTECSRKDEELGRLRNDLSHNQASFKTLKQKIINTDQLLRKFVIKSNECTELEKQIAEWVRKYEKSQSEVLVMDAQLRKTLETMEPVKIEKQDLEKKVAGLEKAKQQVETKLNDVEFVNVQLKMRLANFESEQNSKDEMALENKKKHSSLENKIKNQGNRISKLHTENKSLKVEITRHTRKEKRLENRLHRAETKLVKHLDILVQNGLMTQKAKGKVMTSVTRLDRNMDSDIDGDDDDDDDESLSDLETDDEDKPVTKQSPESANKTTNPTTRAEISNPTLNSVRRRTSSSLSTPDTEPPTPSQTPAVQNKTPVVPFTPLKPLRSRSTSSSSSPTKRKVRERGGMEIALRQLDQLLKWNMTASPLSPLPMSPVLSPKPQDDLMKTSPQSECEGGPMSPLDDGDSDDDDDNDLADDNFGDVPETVPVESNSSVVKDDLTGSVDVVTPPVVVGSEGLGGKDVGKTSTEAQCYSGLAQDNASLTRPQPDSRKLDGTSLPRPQQFTGNKDTVSLPRPHHDSRKVDAVSLPRPQSGKEDTISLPRPRHDSKKHDTVTLSRPHEVSGKQDTTSLPRPQQFTGNQDTVSLSRPQQDSRKQDTTSLSRPHQFTGNQDTTSLTRPQHDSGTQDITSPPKHQQDTGKENTTSLSRPQHDSGKEDTTSLTRSHMVMTRRRSRLESSDSELEAGHLTHPTTSTAAAHTSPRHNNTLKTSVKTTSPSCAADPLRKSNVVGFGDLGSGPSCAEGMLDDFLYSNSDPHPSDPRPNARTSTLSEKENDEPVATTPSGGSNVEPGENIVVNEQRCKDESKSSLCVKNAKTLSDHNYLVSAVPVKSAVENGCVGVDRLHADLNLTSDDSDATDDEKSDNNDDKSDDDEEDNSDKNEDSDNESLTNLHGSDQKRTVPNGASQTTKAASQAQSRTRSLSSAAITSTRAGEKSRDSMTSKPLRGSHSHKTLPAGQKTRHTPVSSKTHDTPLTSKPSQSSSDSYDTSDLSFSDSSLPPDSSSRGQGQGGRGKAKGRDTEKTKKRKRVHVQKLNAKSVKLCKESEANKIRPASRQQSGIDRTGQKTGPQGKEGRNTPSLPSSLPVTPDDLDESSRDSVPVSVHRKKVPVISESSSSEDNACDTETKTSKPLSSKPKVASRQRAAKTSATVAKTPAFVTSDSSDEGDDGECDVSTRVQSSQNVICNGKLPTHHNSGQLQSSSNRNNFKGNASSRNASSSKDVSNKNVSTRSASVGENSNPNSEAQTKPGVVLPKPPSLSDPHPQQVSGDPSLSHQSGVTSSPVTQTAVSSQRHGVTSSTTHAKGEVAEGQNGAGKSGLGVEINNRSCSQLKSLPTSQNESLPNSQNISLSTSKASSLPTSQTNSLPNSQLPGKQQIRKVPHKDSSSTLDPDFVAVGTCYFHLDHQYASPLPDPSHTSVDHTVNPSRPTANVSAASGVPVRHANNATGINTYSTNVHANKPPLNSADVNSSVKNTSLTNADKFKNTSVNNAVLKNAGVTSANSNPDHPGQKQQGGSVTDLPQIPVMSQAGESGIRPCAEISVSDIEADCKQKQSLHQPTLVRPEAVILKSPPLSASRVSHVGDKEGQSESGLVPPLSNSVRNEADGSCSQAPETVTNADVSSRILSPTPSQSLAFLSSSSDTSHLSPFKRVKVKPTKSGVVEGSVCKQLLLGNEPLPSVSSPSSSPLVPVSNALSSPHAPAPVMSPVTAISSATPVNNYPVPSMSAQVSSHVAAPTCSTLSSVVPESVTETLHATPVMSVSTAGPSGLVSVAAPLPAHHEPAAVSGCVSVACTMVSVASTVTSTLTPVSFVSALASAPVSAISKVAPVSKITPVSDVSKVTPVSKITPVSGVSKFTPVSAVCKVAPVSRPLLTTNWTPVPFVSASASANNPPVPVSHVPKVSPVVTSTVVCRPNTASSITVTSTNIITSKNSATSTNSLTLNKSTTSKTNSLTLNKSTTSKTNSGTAAKTKSSMFTPVAFVKASAATPAVPISLPPSSSSTLAPLTQTAESSALPASCSSSDLSLPASSLSSSSSSPVLSSSLISSVSSSSSSTVSSVSSSSSSTVSSVSSSLSTLPSVSPSTVSAVSSSLSTLPSVSTSTVSSSLSSIPSVSTSTVSAVSSSLSTLPSLLTSTVSAVSSSLSSIPSLSTSTVSAVSSSLSSIPSVSTSTVSSGPLTMSSGPVTMSSSTLPSSSLPIVTSTSGNVINTDTSSHREVLTSSQVRQSSQDASTARPSSPGHHASQDTAAYGPGQGQTDKALAICDLFCDIFTPLTPPPSPPPCSKCRLGPSHLPNQPTKRKKKKQKARMTKAKQMVDLSGLSLEAAAYAAKNNPPQLADQACASSNQDGASASSSHACVDGASRKGQADTEGTELADSSSCGSIPQQGRKRRARGGGESGSSPVKKKVSTVRVDLAPRVEEVVSQYFCEKTVSVHSVVCQLQQVASLADCWPSVVNTAVTLVKCDGRDLQPDILKACGGAHLSGTDKKALSGRAFLDQVEIRLMHLLLHCMEVDSGCERDVMMRTLWDAIFTSSAGKPSSITQRSALCRLFVCVCGAEGRVEEVRVLAYHLVLMRCEGLASILLNIAAAWPRALARASVADMTGVVVVMEHLIMSNMGSGTNAAKLGLCFERLCGWQRITWDGETVMNQQIKALQLATSNGHSATSPRVYELCCCLHLLCAANTSMWVVKNFLERAVRSAMMKWASRGEDGVSPHYIIAMLRLTVKVVRHDLPTKSKVLSQFFNVLARNILTSPHRHADVDASCIDMLLSMAPFKPQVVFKLLSDVYNNSPTSSLPAPLRHSITTVRTMVQARHRAKCE